MMPFRTLKLHRTSITWVVILAVAVLTLAPHHYHLHHGSGPDPAHHVHEIDLHIFSDISYEAHHDEAIVLELTPDGLLKPKGDNPLTLLLCVFLLVLPLVVESQSRYRLARAAPPSHPAYYQLSPPLRAPPRQ